LAPLGFEVLGCAETSKAATGKAFRRSVDAELVEATGIRRSVEIL
jgi:hypothetical protein